MADKTKYYPFLPKGSALNSFKTVSAEQFAYTQYGEELSGAYPYVSSIYLDQFYAQSGFISEKRKVYALKNTLNSYRYLSQHYTYSSSLGNKAEQELSIVNIPAIYYGSAIDKGTVELAYYITGTLAAKLQDINKNGELIQTTGAYGLGNVAGVVLYNEGLIVLTGSWTLHPTFQDVLSYYPFLSPQSASAKWTNWGAGLNQLTCSTSASSFDLNFEGVNYVNTITMFAHADKGELNYSNNPTYVKYQTTASQPNSGSNHFTENAFLEIKNTTQYPYENYTGSLQKQTYISKIGIYDENKNLIGIAKLAKPIRKTENRDFTFKLKVDI